MKKIQKIALKEATVLTNEEMKHLFGGSAAPTDPTDSDNSDEESGKTCQCYLIDKSGNKTPAVVIMANPSETSCQSGCSETCITLSDICVRTECTYA